MIQIPISACVSYSWKTNNQDFVSFCVCGKNLNTHTKVYFCTHLHSMSLKVAKLGKLSFLFSDYFTSRDKNEVVNKADYHMAFLCWLHSPIKSAIIPQCHWDTFIHRISFHLGKGSPVAFEWHEGDPWYLILFQLFGHFLLRRRHILHNETFLCCLLMPQALSMQWWYSLGPPKWCGYYVCTSSMVQSKKSHFLW